MKFVLVTTSWDDGHILDIKLASLLRLYNLKGTFYIAPYNKEFTKDKFQKAMEIDTESWKKEVLSHEELFVKLYDRLPKEMLYEKELFLSRLWRSPERWGEIVE